MALTADRDLNFFTSETLVDYGVDQNVRIYKGALVGRNRSTGYARPLLAGDDFLGVAYRQADNTFVGNQAGGINVRVHQGIDVLHPFAGLSPSDIGKDVYANADDTMTLTPTSYSRVGRIVTIESSQAARVRIRPTPSLSGVLENQPFINLADQNVTLNLDFVNKTLAMANTAARTLTLPAATTVRAGGWLRVIKTSANAFAITLDGNAAELIDGAATFAAVDAQFDVVELLCTGSEWVIVSRDIA